MRGLIVVRVILSYFRHDPQKPVFRFIYDVTEPILYPVRRMIPLFRSAPVDFSPIFAFFLLYLIEWFIIRVLQLILW